VFDTATRAELRPLIGDTPSSSSRDRLTGYGDFIPACDPGCARYDVDRRTTALLRATPVLRGRQRRPATSAPSGTKGHPLAGAGWVFEKGA